MSITRDSLGQLIHEPQHIYITSDEEIKEGDWYYLPRTNSVHKCIEDPTELNLERRLGVAKIILTTDLDLIANGVQAIDDEFLEWFIKNPSCESVEVKEKQHFEANKSKRINPLNGVYYSYKIILPQEEPKQEFPLFDEEKADAITKQGQKIVRELQNTIQQEALEEAAEVFLKKYDYQSMRFAKLSCNQEFKEINIKAVTEGARLQAERMYSEEEVLTIIKAFDKDFYQGIVERNGHTNKWFERFKKK
jgi:hypothetical protein